MHTRKLAALIVFMLFTALNFIQVLAAPSPSFKPNILIVFNKELRGDLREVVEGYAHSDGHSLLPVDVPSFELGNYASSNDACRRIDEQIELRLNLTRAQPDILLIVGSHSQVPMYLHATFSDLNEGQGRGAGDLYSDFIYGDVGNDGLPDMATVRISSSWPASLIKSLLNVKSPLDYSLKAFLISPSSELRERPLEEVSLEKSLKFMGVEEIVTDWSSALQYKLPGKAFIMFRGGHGNPFQLSREAGWGLMLTAGEILDLKTYPLVFIPVCWTAPPIVWIDGRPVEGSPLHSSFIVNGASLYIGATMVVYGSREEGLAMGFERLFIRDLRLKNKGQPISMVFKESVRSYIIDRGLAQLIAETEGGPLSLAKVDGRLFYLISALTWVIYGSPTVSMFRGPQRFKEPPKINSITIERLSPTTAMVKCLVSDDIWIGRVELNYSINDGPWNSIDMKSRDGADGEDGVYMAIIKVPDGAFNIALIIKAVDSDGNHAASSYGKLMAHYIYFYLIKIAPIILIIIGLQILSKLKLKLRKPIISTNRCLLINH